MSGFNVFLAHNSKDKLFVTQIAEKLEHHGVSTWLDEQQIRPGIPFQLAIQEGISSCDSAAVFIGPDGIGPWQATELLPVIEDFVERAIPVIPVLLPGVEGVPKELRILRQFRYVPFCSADDVHALRLLVWGITGDDEKVSRACAYD